MFPAGSNVKSDAVEAAYSAPEALFAGLAFLDLLSTIWIQRQELRLQRFEMAQTREEMRRQAEAQEKTEQALQAQAEALRDEAQRQARAYLRISLVPTGSSSWASSGTSSVPDAAAKGLTLSMISGCRTIAVGQCELLGPQSA